MGPDLELKGRSENVMESSVNKGSGSAVKVLDDKCMSFESNYEDYSFEMGASLDEQAVHRSEDAEVNVIECTNSGDNVLVQAELAEATENSSSFGDTVSDIENGDSEIMSELRGDTTSPMAFDGFCEVFPMRKKKLTSHWRTFIRPLMWRCKCVELQIKKLQSQGIKYDRGIAECNQRQLFELENFTLQDLGAKSLPFSSQSRREKVMKRKKRKRVEDTTNVAAYMSHHKLFFCYENRKSTTDGAYLDDDWDNLGKGWNLSLSFVSGESVLHYLWLNNRERTQDMKAESISFWSYFFNVEIFLVSLTM